MRGSRFVDPARVAQGRICPCIVTGLLDADGDSEEWASILLSGGGRVVWEELRDTVGRNVCLESLPEGNVSDGRGRGFSDPARVDDLSQ
jgi:hypothetical protein